MAMATWYSVLAVLVSFSYANGTTGHHAKPVGHRRRENFDALKWLIGHWKGNDEGKVFWPTIPRMTFTEELIIREAPLAKNVAIRFLNITARAWSPSEKDHMHNEMGFMTIDDNGNVTLMTSSDNVSTGMGLSSASAQTNVPKCFSTFEEGWIESKRIVLRLKKIGRISFSRDLPVEDLERKFIRLDGSHLEQTLAMRTSTNPKNGLLDHSYIIYEKISN